MINTWKDLHETHNITWRRLKVCESTESVELLQIDI